MHGTSFHPMCASCQPGEREAAIRNQTPVFLHDCAGHIGLRKHHHPLYLFIFNKQFGLGSFFPGISGFVLTPHTLLQRREYVGDCSGCGFQGFVRLITANASPAWLSHSLAAWGERPSRAVATIILSHYGPWHCCCESRQASRSPS